MLSLLYQFFKMDSKKLSDDPSTKELNQFVQNMLKQMQERFDDMSSNIVGRVDEMGTHNNIKVDASTTSRNLWAKL
jgi:predicted Zn-dependent protease with MMP-like domain